MKKYIKIFVLSLVALTLTSLSAEAQGKKKIEEVTFLVDIHCNDCVKKLEANLPFEKGVKGLKVDLEGQTITFKYQTSKTNEETLKKAITKLGSEVKGVKEEDKD